MFSAFMFETQVEIVLAIVASGISCVLSICNLKNPTSTKAVIGCLHIFICWWVQWGKKFEKFINIRNQFVSLQIFFHGKSFVVCFFPRNYGMHCGYQANCPINSFRSFKHYELQDSIFNHSCSNRHFNRCVRLGDEHCSV